MVRVTGQRPAQRRTAMMFQNYALFPHLNCVGNVAFSLKMRGVRKAERAHSAREMLELVEMEDHGAEAAGAAVRRAAAARRTRPRAGNDPDVLLLDEPLSALDPFLRVRMREELKRFQRQFGITFIHVTHSQDEALALADLVIVMNEGRIEQADTPRAVFDRPTSTFVARFIGGHNVLRCTVDAADGHGARLCGPMGIPIKTNRPGLSAGRAIDVAIRNDRMCVGRIGDLLVGNGAAADCRQALLSRVSAVEYQGSVVKLRLQTDGVDDFTVTLPDQAFYEAEIHAGDAVAVGWRDADVHVLN